MARSKRTPKLCHHKATGQAVVRIDGKDFYCGRYGTPKAEAGAGHGVLGYQIIHNAQDQWKDLFITSELTQLLEVDFLIRRLIPALGLPQRFSQAVDHAMFGSERIADFRGTAL